MSCNSTCFNLDYAPALRQKILKLLLSGSETAVNDVINLLTFYNLTKEDMDSIIEITQLPNTGDTMTKVAPKVG